MDLRHSVALDRSSGVYKGSQTASDPSKGQAPTQAMSHDLLDGKTHVLYVMYDPSGRLDPNCAEAEYYASRISSVFIQDAMKLQSRPAWLTVIPTLACLKESRGNQGAESVSELKHLFEQQDQIKTIGIAKPLERDANGFPAYAGLGGSMTNSAMLTVGSVIGLKNQDPNRYQEGKMSGNMSGDAIQNLLDRRQQQRPFTNIPF